MYDSGLDLESLKKNLWSSNIGAYEASYISLFTGKLEKVISSVLTYETMPVCLGMTAENSYVKSSAQLSTPYIPSEKETEKVLACQLSGSKWCWFLESTGVRFPES